ncbi:MAG: HAD hydrolase-like protein [Oscillospiraceae bacterium]|nr:HAD hydrolase-like protein [Oscillospiraceae bacterium]
MDKIKKLAIFDLDGTLADTLEDLANAVNYGLGNLGYPEHNIDKYNQFVGNGVQKLCERALPDAFKDNQNITQLHREFDFLL